MRRLVWDGASLDLAAARAFVDHQPLPPLPFYLPVINPTCALARQLPLRWCAIPVHLMLRVRSGRLRSLAGRVPVEARCVLTGCSPDAALERVWGLGESWWFDEPVLREFDIVCAPNFSTYVNDPEEVSL